MSADKMCDMAIDLGVPWWAAEELLPELNQGHIEKIKNKSDRNKEIKFLCGIFPELKNKIKYRYEKSSKSDRSMFKESRGTPY